MVAQVFNPRTGRQKQAGGSEFEASLVYKVSFRTASATQRNLVSKQTTNKQTMLMVNEARVRRAVHFTHYLMGG